MHSAKLVVCWTKVTGNLGKAVKTLILSLSDSDSSASWPVIAGGKLFQQTNPVKF